MNLKWTSLTLVGIALGAALFNSNENEQYGVPGSTMTFQLSDAWQGERSEWVRSMDICETAPEQSDLFQHFGPEQVFGSSQLDLYLNMEGGLMCRYWEDRLVSAYLFNSDLPWTHQFTLRSNGNQSEWQFGPSTRERGNR